VVVNASTWWVGRIRTEMVVIGTDGATIACGSAITLRTRRDTPPTMPVVSAVVESSSGVARTVSIVTITSRTLFPQIYFL